MSLGSEFGPSPYEDRLVVPQVTEPAPNDTGELAGQVIESEPADATLQSEDPHAEMLIAKVPASQDPLDPEFMARVLGWSAKQIAEYQQRRADNTKRGGDESKLARDADPVKLRPEYKDIL